jgi:hypothetical protein
MYVAPNREKVAEVTLNLGRALLRMSIIIKIKVKKQFLSNNNFLKTMRLNKIKQRKTPK